MVLKESKEKRERKDNLERREYQDKKVHLY